MPSPPDAVAPIFGHFAHRVDSVDLRNLP